MNAPNRLAWALLGLALSAGALADLLVVRTHALASEDSQAHAQALSRIANLQRLNDEGELRLIEARLPEGAGAPPDVRLALDPLEMQAARLWRLLSDAALGDGLHGSTAHAVATQRRFWEQLHEEAMLLNRHELTMADTLRRVSLPRARADAQTHLAALGDEHLAALAQPAHDAWWPWSAALALALLALGATAAAGWQLRRRPAPPSSSPASPPAPEAEPDATPAPCVEAAAEVTRRLEAHVASCCQELHQRLKALGQAELAAREALRQRPVAEAPLAIKGLAERLDAALAQSHELTSLALILATPWTGRLGMAGGAAELPPAERAEMARLRDQATHAADETSRLALQVLARLQSAQQQLRLQAAELPRLHWEPPQVPEDATRDALLSRAQALADQIATEALRLQPLAEPLP